MSQQDTPYNSGGFGAPTGFGSGTGSTGTGSTGTGSTGTGSGGTGSSGMGGSSTGSGGSSTGGTGSDVTSSMSGGTTHSGTGPCPTCGQASGSGLEQFLGRIGISEDMINNLKSSFANVDIEEYLTTAREYLKDGRDYLKDGSGKATTYAKDNPGKVAAGVAVLAVGAGLLINSLRDKE